MVSSHVAHLLAAGNRHHFAFNLDYGRAIGELDVKGVAGEGEDFFFEDDGFGLPGGELGEDADGRGALGGVGHVGSLQKKSLGCSSGLGSVVYKTKADGGVEKVKVRSKKSKMRRKDAAVIIRC